MFLRYITIIVVLKILTLFFSLFVFLLFLLINYYLLSLQTSKNHTKLKALEVTVIKCIDSYFMEVNYIICSLCQAENENRQYMLLYTLQTTKYSTVVTG